MRAVDHWLRAEALVEELTDQDKHGDAFIAYEADGARETLAAAQVHATLALAGATAMQAYSTAKDAELDDWAKDAGGAE